MTLRGPRDPYDVVDDARPDSDDYPPPPFSADSDFDGFPRAESAGPRIEPSPPSRRRGMWLSLSAIAVATAASVATILAVGAPADARPPKPDSSTTPASPSAMTAAQVGDCLTFADQDDEDSWRLVKCDDAAALGRIYGFALGSLDAADCPRPPDGERLEYHYALDYPDSRRDDYVVCATKLDG